MSRVEYGEWADVCKVDHIVASTGSESVTRCSGPNCVDAALMLRRIILRIPLDAGQSSNGGGRG